MAATNNLRRGCAFHGALRTALAIEGLTPIAHTNQGCALQCYLADRDAGVRFPYAGYHVPATGVIERHVVFGGGSRLREQIKNTTKVANGDAYIVVNGCESAMVGDDSPAMVKEAAAQGEKVISCEAPGFRGGAEAGYGHVLSELFRADVLPPVEVPETGGARIVNIFGILPGTDVFFRGELAEIRRLLAGIGVSANTFFGSGGLREIGAAKGAALSICLSEYGAAPAALLEERFGVPVLAFDAVPVGLSAVDGFLRAAGAFLKTDAEQLQAFVDEEERRYRRYLGILREVYHESRLSRGIALLTDEAHRKGYAQFFEEALGGWITDGITADTGVILGSAAERGLAAEAQLPLLEAGYPLRNQTPLSKHYIGIDGAIRLAEDYAATIAAFEDGRLA